MTYPTDPMTSTIGLLFGIFVTILLSWALVNGIVLLWLSSAGA